MINTVRLRAMLGWLGMLLPWIVFCLAYSDPTYTGYLNHIIPVDSISATYFIGTCITPFMIILGSASILLISYKGYTIQDDLICTLAGIAGLGVCLFPCSATSAEFVGTFAMATATSGLLHNIFAAIFFILLSYNSLFLFTKSTGEKTSSKKKRNIIFIICGIGMIASFLFIPLKMVLNLNFYGGVWLAEMAGLTFFGISWLTKSNIYPWLFAEKKG